MSVAKRLTSLEEVWGDLHGLIHLVMRNRVRHEAFMRKRMNTNPSRGPFHESSPAKIFQRTVRGMVPHKTARGSQAMDRLRCFVGCPAPYDKMKRMVVPDAFRITRLR